MEKCFSSNPSTSTKRILEIKDLLEEIYLSVPFSEVENVPPKKVCMLRSKVKLFSNNYSIYSRVSAVAS